jgi:two-component system KDP operon response regulator KdpE
MNATTRPSPVSALLVGDFTNERPLVHEVFQRCGWKLYEAPDRRTALDCLDRHRVQVVIAESELPNWNWKRVLYDLRSLSETPQLVVASRTADDYLWSEVLNMGGYDVLPRPLEKDEVERVIAAARRHYERPARALAASADAVTSVA